MSEENGSKKIRNKTNIFFPNVLDIVNILIQ